VSKANAYKRLQKSSIHCIVANDRIIMKQIVVNGNFRHKEFGIKAGFWSLSCLPIQQTKAGIKVRLVNRIINIDALFIIEASDETILEQE
jgi:hypothetical protein